MQDYKVREVLNTLQQGSSCPLTPENKKICTIKEACYIACVGLLGVFILILSLKMNNMEVQLNNNAKELKKVSIEQAVRTYAIQKMLEK